MIEMFKNTNEWFKSLIENTADQKDLKLTRGIEVTMLIILWSLTPWLGLYGVVNRIVWVLNGRF